MKFAGTNVHFFCSVRLDTMGLGHFHWLFSSGKTPIKSALLPDVSSKRINITQMPLSHNLTQLLHR
jgi:hypothetical protein